MLSDRPLTRAGQTGTTPAMNTNNPSRFSHALAQLAGKAARILPAELAHTVGLAGARALPWGNRAAPAPHLATRLGPLALPSPIGLAAGFDKNAQAADALLAMGFGFVEVGAVTPHPQAGNAKPRVFRLAQDRAIINRFGFNNQGMDVVADRLAHHQKRGKTGVIGVNLGANKDSDDKPGDYARVLSRLWGLADFFTVNVSSPNTPGLRDLQGGDALRAVLERVGQARATLPGTAPVLVKVAPDLTEHDMDTMASVFATPGLVDGLIVSNTTITRPESLVSRNKTQAGGLSGRPVFDMSTRVLKGFARRLAPTMPLIGVGGVEDGATAYAKIRAGACAVQLYTALVYQGPGVIARIENELAALLKADGFSQISQAIGLDIAHGPDQLD